MVEKCCNTCARCRFGFPSDPSYDACDYTCNIDGGSFFLFCTHGLTPKEISRKLRSIGRTCKKWKRVI